MAKIVSGTFAGYAFSSINFSLVLGSDPGTGTVTIPGGSLNIPYMTSMTISDNENTYTLNQLFVTAVREVKTATAGIDTVCSFCDRRLLWKYGYINGIYNEEDYRGVPQRDFTLPQLLDIIFWTIGETNYYYYGVPNVYPEVVWEYENPGQALNELCDRYQLCIGYDLYNGGRIIVCPINYARQVPVVDAMEEENGITDLLLPNSIILVGDREVRQVRFEGLIPVGEDIDGSVKPINELSYAPVGAGQGGEAYPYELWGEEIRTCFQNLTSLEARELAEKSVFKWYRIDHTKYDLNVVLPLLNEISDVETIEGITDHAKPYIYGEVTEWNGHEFITNPMGKITDGYQIDKKMGMVTFNEPKVKARTTGAASGGFTAATIDLVAAYERFEGSDDDFITVQAAIAGGVLPPAVHKESSLVGWYKQTSPIGTPFESLEFTLLNETEVLQYANEVLNQLYSQYVTITPKTVKYPGLYLVGAYGALKQVSFNMTATAGVEVEFQYGLELPKLHIKSYEEKLNTKFLEKDLKQEAKSKRQRRRQESMGKGKRQQRAPIQNNIKERFGIYKKYAKDIRLGVNETGADIPAKSVVAITSYNATHKAFNIQLNDGTGKLLATVPEGIKDGKVGVLLLDGAGVITKKAGETIAVGDKVTATAGSTTCEKSSSGEYTVTKVDGDDIYVEKSSGANTGEGSIYAVVTQVPAYNSAVDYYTVEKVNLINGVWTKDTIPITIDRALGYEGYIAATDIRNWIPWPPIGSIVEIVKKYDVAAAEDKWFISTPSMIYAGPENEASLRHSESNGHVEAVWV